MKYIVVLLLCCFSALIPAAEKPLKVFVLIGQSNMVGKRCVAKQLPEHLQKPQEQVLYFAKQDTGWQAIKPGITEAKGFGPELSFGYELQKALGESIGIIKLSRGGTNLHKQWSPNDKKSLYHQTLKRCQAAAKTRPITFAGILWVQGGADAKTAEMANAYLENYQAFVDTWRKDLNNPDLAVVCGRCGTTTNPKAYRAKKPHIDIVRKAQDGLPYKKYVSVDLDDVSVGNDHVHFDTKGMVETGVRYAKAMATLLKQ